MKNTTRSYLRMAFLSTTISVEWVTFWKVCSGNFVWNESMYDILDGSSIAFKNFHATLLKLCNGDGNWYNHYRNSIMNMEKN